MCRWLTKTYGYQNVFDDLGFSDFQRWQRKLMAEREITEEYKLQNCLCFCRKSPSFNNSLQKMYYIPGYTAVNSKVFWFLRCIFFCRSCLLIHHLLFDWMSVLYLATCQTTVLSSAKNCFCDLWTVIVLDVTAFLRNSLWSTALRERN